MTATTKARLTADERAAALVMLDGDGADLDTPFVVYLGPHEVGRYRLLEHADEAVDEIRIPVAAALRDHERDLLHLAFEALPERPVSEEREAEIRKEVASRRPPTSPGTYPFFWLNLIGNLLALLDHARAERDACAAEAAFMRREEDVQARLDEAVRQGRREGWRIGCEACVKAAYDKIGPCAGDDLNEAVPEDMPEGEP